MTKDNLSGGEVWLDKSQPYLFGVPSAEDLYDDIITAFELQIDPMLGNNPKDGEFYYIDQWAIRGTKDLLPTKEMLIDWVTEWAYGETFSEGYAEDVSDSAPLEQISKVIDEWTNKITYRVSGRKVARHTITFGKSGEPRINGHPLYGGTKLSSMGTWNEAVISTVDYLSNSKLYPHKNTYESDHDHLYDNAERWIAGDRSRIVATFNASIGIIASSGIDRATVKENLIDLLVTKQQDYGPQNILRFGESGIRVRVSDKIERIKNLTSRGESGSSEPLEDAYYDIAGYAVISKMLEDGVFELPLAEPTKHVSPQTEPGSPITNTSRPEWFDDARFVGPLPHDPEQFFIASRAYHTQLFTYSDRWVEL